jgi:hypothetical protein
MDNEKKFTHLIDINKFLPSTTDPSILTALYEETYVATNSQEDFFNLPVNEDYKKNKENDKKENTIVKKSNND